MREVELGPDLASAGTGAALLAGRRSLPVRPKVLPHLLRFIDFD